jgi:hypothetical protein
MPTILHMGDHNEPPLKRTKVAIPPKLMQIVQEAATDHVSGDVTAAVVVIQGKALRSLDSYLNCVCIRMRE